MKEKEILIGLALVLQGMGAWAEGTMPCAIRLYSLPGQQFMHKLVTHKGETVTERRRTPALPTHHGSRHRHADPRGHHRHQPGPPLGQQAEYMEALSTGRQAPCETRVYQLTPKGRKKSHD